MRASATFPLYMVAPAEALSPARCRKASGITNRLPAPSNSTWCSLRKLEDEVDCFFSILLDLDFQRQQASMGSKDSPFSLEAYDRYTEKQPDVDRHALAPFR